MTIADSTPYLEWLDLDLDQGPDGASALAPHERERLAARLVEDADLRAEHRALEALHGALTSDRLAPREGFAEEVMASLPEPAWAPRPTAWRLPLAAMLAFALSSVLLLGGAGTDGAIFGTGLAIVDFLQTTTLAGAGLAVAAWQGAGYGLEEAITGSAFDLATFAVLVLSLNLLFLSLLRRPRAVTAAASVGSAASSEQAEERGT